MKRFFQLMAVIAMTAILAGTAYAWTYDEHLALAPNGKGDALLFPVYSTDDGWETKIQVFNTSLTTATVAKVAVYTGPYSDEVLDFLIFLTPTDGWEGVLRQVDGQVIMYSDDDSTLTSYFPTFATPAAPAVFPLVESRFAECGDINEVGYVTVELGWVWNNDIPGTPNTVPGMPKMRYNEDGTPRFDLDSLYVRYLPYIDSNFVVNPTGGRSAYEARRDFNVNTNILAGYMYIDNPVLGQSASLQAITFKNLLNQDALNVEVQNRFGELSRNSVTEIEAVLSKNNVAMPYVNDGETVTWHINTFPTKQSELDMTRNAAGEPRCFYIHWWQRADLDNWVSRFSGFDVNGRVPFAVRAMDMMENTPTPGRPIISPVTPGPIPTMPREVNFNQAIVDYEKGWYLYNFLVDATVGPTANNDTLVYTGAPVVPVILKVGPQGMTLNYASWNDGVVRENFENGTVLPNYHYRDTVVR